MTARLSQRARIDAAVEADSDRVSELAFTLWRTAQSLAVQPEGALAMPHVRQSLIEVQDVLKMVIGEVGCE